MPQATAPPNDNRLAARGIALATRQWRIRQATPAMTPAMTPAIIADTDRAIGSVGEPDLGRSELFEVGEATTRLVHGLAVLAILNDQVPQFHGSPGHRGTLRSILSRQFT